MAGKGKDELFFCGNCGYESKKWMGQCPSCKAWGAFSEAPVMRTVSVKGRSGNVISGVRGLEMIRPVPIKDISASEEERIPTGFDEFSRVLGGGIVPGSLVLIGGDPGIGKSTLLLQTAANVAGGITGEQDTAFAENKGAAGEGGRQVIYISGEESLKQIKLRADRIGDISDNLRFVSETNIDKIIALLEKERPELCIIDSIQTMYTEDAQSVPGSITQVRECAQRMMMCAKSLGIATFLVGHVTKEGTVAGPRVLEHIVDTVIYFESGEQFGYRILRSAKNRFGSTNEVGVFEMSEEGLKAVKNPSEYLLEGRPVNATGAVVTCLMEGSRALLLEVQGLVSESQYNLARRQANGMDYNRLSMLMAVLSRRAGLDLNALDAYVNIAGGMKVTQPSVDLAVIAALISAAKNLVIPGDTVIFGEVGLSGEVRAVPQAAERVKEAAKLGFKRVIMPQINVHGLKKGRVQGFDMESLGVEVVGVRFISELFGIL
ncbi:MAG: DNA repair protein RadA [Eubacteriales bacterium]|nr:DNA repair protein RadA [Eubacteriales bacterium]